MLEAGVITFLLQHVNSGVNWRYRCRHISIQGLEYGHFVKF